jgi:hypothetical protein
MSEGIIIALITAVGSIVGAIGGNFINARATVIAASMNNGKSQPNEGISSSRIRWTVAGGLFGAIIVLAGLWFLGLFPSFSANAISVANKSSVLLDENFDDEQLRGMSVSGNWEILSDETGNKVLDTDSRSSGSNFVGFGSEAWQDYDAEFRVRFLSAKNYGAGLEFRRTCQDQDCKRYVLTLWSDYINLFYDSPETPYTPIEGSTHKLESQTWYTIRIVVKGVNIKIYLNDSLIIDANDSRLARGSLLLGIENNHVQLDDFRVVGLDK